MVLKSWEMKIYGFIDLGNFFKKVSTIFDEFKLSEDPKKGPFGGPSEGPKWPIDRISGPLTRSKIVEILYNFFPRSMKPYIFISQLFRIIAAL